jgi:hypothetical protein
VWRRFGADFTSSTSRFFDRTPWDVWLWTVGWWSATFIKSEDDGIKVALSGVEEVAYVLLFKARGLGTVLYACRVQRAQKLCFHII